MALIFTVILWGVISNAYFPVGFLNQSNLQDPFLVNVVLHIKGDGVNNSTTIVDSSPTPKVITRVGDTKISTAQSKYGGSSIYFDGSGDYLSLPVAEFTLGTSDFTLETWVYLFEKMEHRLFGTYNVANLTQDKGWTVYIINGAFCFYDSSIGNISIKNNIPLNQWMHLAVTRQGNTFKGFVNGILEVSTSVSIIDTWTGNNFFVGSTNDRFIVQNNQLDSHCYLDSLRVTKGIARYTTNFNPETDTYLAY